MQLSISSDQEELSQPGHAHGWPCLPSWEMGISPLSDMCTKCSPAVFLMLMSELSLVPLKEGLIGWLISPYINLFHAINPFFFSRSQCRREMVLETNPFTLCCVENKPLLLESRNKAKTQTHFSACSWLLLLHGVNFRELFFPQKHSKKD